MGSREAGAASEETASLEAGALEAGALEAGVLEAGAEPWLQPAAETAQSAASRAANILLLFFIF